jgi:hypothetical protein
LTTNAAEEEEKNDDDSKGDGKTTRMMATMRWQQATINPYWQSAMDKGCGGSGQDGDSGGGR